MIYQNAGKLAMQVGSAASSASATYETTAAVLNVAIGGDPYFANVKLLLHGEGALTDSSSVGNTFGSVSHVGATAVRSRYGTGSIIATNEDATAKIAASAAFQETAAYTMEFSFYADSALMYASGQTRYCLARDNSRYFTVVRNAGGISIGNSGWGAQGTATGLSLDAWHDIAWVRDAAGTVYVYADGVRVQTFADTTGYTANTTNREFNLVNVGTGGFFLGAYGVYLDEIRYTANVARYTGASYTRAPFPDNAGTVTIGWNALAVVIAAGVPHIYVDGVEKVGAFASGAATATFAWGFNNTTVPQLGVYPSVVIGSATYTTTAPYEGTHSARIASAGNFHLLRTLPALVGDFELTLRVRFEDGVSSNIVTLSAGNVNWVVYRTSAGSTNSIRLYNGADRITGAAGSWTTGVWYELKLVRTSGVVTMYFNGVAQGSTYANAATLPAGESFQGILSVATRALHEIPVDFEVTPPSR